MDDEGTVTETLKEDEWCRLYIGEDIWKLFSTYQTLLLICWMKLKMASTGAGKNYTDDQKLIEQIKEVMPHFSEYLDQWGISGAAGLAIPLRDAILKSLKTALSSNDADVADAVAAREIVELNKRLVAGDRFGSEGIRTS